MGTLNTTIRPQALNLENFQTDPEHQQPSISISSRLSKRAVETKRSKLPIHSNYIDLSAYVIEDLQDNYFLAVHPYPLLEGQCVLFYQVNANGGEMIVTEDNQSYTGEKYTT